MANVMAAASKHVLRNCPDFFLVGAPKCATSSLHALLIRHPDIFMCSPKEPHFFSSDLPGLSEVANGAEYDALFDAASEGARLGEASAFYLMSEDAPQRIHAVNPNARIIISLRNPTQAARSWYHQLRDGFREDQTSFETAWSLQKTRAEGKSLPSYCPEPRQLQYRDIYSYAGQVGRYLDIFGRKQVLVLRFEEIAQAPQQVIDRILDFLDLPPFEESIELPKTNTRRQPRFPWLTQMISAPPPALRPLVGPIKRGMNAVGLKPSVIMMKYLSRSGATAKPKLESDFQNELLASFTEDITRLEAVLQLDLSDWRK